MSNVQTWPHNMLRILVIDDDAGQLRLRSRFLAPLGYQVYAAQSTAEGRSLAQRHRPDLILLDWHMGQESGLELLKKLKSDPAVKRIPVIMMSGLMDGEAERELALRAGACHFLGKSRPQDELPELIERFVEPRPLPPRLRRVLLIIADPELRGWLRAVLARAGMQVHEALEGCAGFEKADMLDPDIILLDLALSDANGIQVLDRLKNSGRLRGIPVVAVSGLDPGAGILRSACANLGAAEFLQKPFEEPALWSALSRAADRAAGAKECAAAPGLEFSGGAETLERGRIRVNPDLLT